MTSLILLPQPQSITYREGEYALSGNKLIAIGSADYLPSARRIQAALAKLGLHWEIVAGTVPAQRAGILMQGSSPVEKHEGYSLHIGANQIAINGGAEPQAYWNAACTLVQIIEQCAETRRLPALEIADWPDFERRGVMLDISRDKVPTMETLYALVDKLAGWKINEVQLYTEHTFAYQAHPVVWAHASPMTAEQIMALDAYCRERYIDLVPNQNSFGHMHRWLMHKEYAHLAEVPAGFDWPFMLTPRPFSISPALPDSLELVKKLYDELLPNFSSRYFNVGCDETFDLGKGRSKELAEAQGRGRVYLDFLRQIAELVRGHGRIMQFWGDIIMDHPELVAELPKDLIALEWGYEADHPFDRDGARFKEAGIKFYVCPGTSSWISLLGRTDNALGNLCNAAENGLKHGAMGYLITDWGDFGHWQTLPVSYLGFAYGAGVSWCYQTNKGMDLPAALSRYAFEDPTGTMGKLACDLGNVYNLASDYPHRNGATMVRALFTPLEKISSRAWLPQDLRESLQFNPENVRAAMAEADHLAALLDSTHPADSLVIPEYKMAVGLWKHGCKRMLMALEPDSFTRGEMYAELRDLMSEFVACWMARNRPGGLGDSIARMARMFTEYEAS